MQITERHRPNLDILKQAATEISKAISEIDKHWVLKRFSCFSLVEDPRDLRMTVNMFLTSWLHYGSQCEWNIPGTNTVFPDAIRKPWSTDEGGNIIMPRRRKTSDGQDTKAPYEVLIQLVDKDMATMEAEKGGLTTYAERVIM
jgi:hypothetical protein